MTKGRPLEENLWPSRDTSSTAPAPEGPAEGGSTQRIVPAESTAALPGVENTAASAPLLLGGAAGPRGRWPTW